MDVEAVKALRLEESCGTREDEPIVSEGVFDAVDTTPEAVDEEDAAGAAAGVIEGGEDEFSVN